MSDTERESDRSRPLLLFPDQPHTPEPLSASVSGADSDKSDRLLLSQRTSSTPVESVSASNVVATGPAVPSADDSFARERNDPHSTSFSELSGVSEVYEQLPGSSQPQDAANTDQPQRIKISSRASGPANGSRGGPEKAKVKVKSLDDKSVPLVKVDGLGDDEDLVNVDRGRDFDSLIENQAELRSIWAKIQTIRTAQALVFAYVYAETRRSKRAFAIGCFTVLLVVCFVSLLQNAISSSPLIFLKLSENSVGEMDLIMTPGFSVSGSTYIKSDVSGLPLLNNSYIDSRVGGSDDLVEGVSPRWVLLSSLQSQVSTKEVSAIVFAYNSDQEKRIGLGRDWKFPTLKSDECYVSRTIVLQTGLDLATAVGKPITATVNLLELLNAAGVISTDTNDITSNDLIGIIGAIYPNITSVWNTNFTVSVAQLFNVSSVDVNVILDFVSPQNLTRALIDLENTIQPFTNVQLPNATFLLNVTDAEYASAAQNLVNQLLLPNVTLSLTFGDLVQLALPTLSQNLVLSRTFSIAGVVDDPKGKWPTALGSVMALEEAAFSQVLKDSVLAFAAVFQNLSDITIPVTPQFSVTLSLYQVIETLPNITPAQRQTLIDALNNYEQRTAYFSSTAFKDFVQEQNIEDYAFTTIAMFKERLKAYTADLVTMNKDIIKFTDRIAAKIGFSYPATFSVPLKNALTTSMYARYFLDNIFGSVVALVVVLGIMLIYALMLNDIEGKTYEYGMLRALGMKNLTLVQLLITKSLVFAIPGIGLGLFLAFLGNMGVQTQISAFTALPQTYTLYDVAVLLAFSLGILVPLIANVVPISRALSKTLRDSLDIYHHVISEVQVTVTRLANMGLDLWLTCLSILTILMGFVVFYIVPYAFTFGKFDIFLGILNGILLGMLVGLCILAMAIQPYLEKLIVWLMLWGSHRRLIRVVRKNLSGHRNRNRKTSQMFTLCLAFVIFAGAMFALQSRNIEDNVKVLFGADILVTAPSEKVALQEEQISAYLDDQINQRRQGNPNGVVEDYAYITFDLRRDDGVDYFRVSSLPMYPSVRQAIYGVQQNHLAVTYNNYYVVNDYRGNNFPSVGGKKDVLAGMYTDAGNARLPEESNGIVVPASVGSGVYDGPGGFIAYNGSNDNIFSRPAYTDAYKNYLDVVIGSALTPFASIDLNIPMQFVVGANDPVKGWQYQYYLAKPRGIVSKVPAFFFSSYQSAVRLGAVLIRMDEWNRLAQNAREWKNLTIPPSPPKQRLLVRCKDGATDKQRQDVINGLGAFFQSNNITATDTLSTIESAQRSFALLSLFFNVVGAIAMLMCFFILWLSFTANVQEHAWEFGVLRSLGVSAFQTLMIYVYESLAIVLASVILGTTIGLVIAISLTLQFNLFVEMPFNFEFPWVLFFSMFSMAIVVAVGGSGIPAYSFTKKTISNVLRRN